MIDESESDDEALYRLWRYVDRHGIDPGELIDADRLRQRVAESETEP